MTHRRAFIAGSAALAIGGGARAQTAPDARFHAYIEALWPAARAAGVSRQTFDATLQSLTPDPALIGSGGRQAEFERTINVYIDAATGGGRPATGRDMRARHGATLARIERDQGVPAEITLAVWGMETNFGLASAGDRDVPRSLATLGYSRKDDSFGDEVVAALVMLERGDIARDRFKGSWAGATGQPQFLPSAYLKYAVALDHAGAPNIWTSVPDSLASIAHFLRAQGWKPGLVWGVETIVPAGFDWRALTGGFAAFSAKGFRRADGGALPGGGEATLYLPAGAGGPAFLLSENYWIIKQYNNSDSYAMSVALLGERIAGRAAIRAKWPTDFRLLSPADRISLQTLLRDRGFYDGKIDGRFGPASRDAIHRFQTGAGLMPADGFASVRVLEALQKDR